MYCKKCGYKNQDDAKYCDNCGSELKQSSKKRKMNTATKVLLAVVIMLALAAITVLVLILLSNKKAKDYDENLSMGDKYFKEASYEDAILAYQEAISIDKRNPKAYIAMSEAYMNMDDYQNAADILRTAPVSGMNEENQDRIIEQQKRVDKKQENYEKENNDSGNTDDQNKKETFDDKPADDQVKLDELVQADLDRRIALQRIVYEYRNAVSYGANNVLTYGGGFQHVNMLALQFCSDQRYQIKYALYDIDGNGTDELLFGLSYGEGFGVMDVYGCDGSNVNKFFDDDTLAERSQLTIYEDGTLYIYGSSGAQHGSAWFYRIKGDGCSVEAIEQYKVDYETSPNYPYIRGNESLSEDEFEAKFTGKTAVDNFDWKELDVPITGYTTEQLLKLCKDQLPETLYFDYLKPTTVARYTGNEGDSFIDVVKMRNGFTDVDYTQYDHGLEIWMARWNGESEKSWVWNEYELPAEYQTFSANLTILQGGQNNNNFDVTLQIIGDEQVLYEKELTPGDYKDDIEINIAGVKKLKISIMDNKGAGGGTSFLLGNPILK